MNSMKLRAAIMVVAGAIATFGCIGNAFAVAGGKGIQPNHLRNSQLVVLGPVEKVDLANGVLIIAGQTVTVNAATSISLDGAAAGGNALSLQQIQVGDLVAAYGQIGAPSTSVNRLGSSYVAGATNIFVTGRVSSVDAAIGSAKINGLTVDYTAGLSDPTFSGLSVGDLVSVSGIQPVAEGQLLANKIFRVSTASVVGASSIIGTGAQTNSIIGTGGPNELNHWHRCSDANSIIGTGAQTRSIIGTGAQTRSIIGTGAQSLNHRHW